MKICWKYLKNMSLPSNTDSSYNSRFENDTKILTEWKPERMQYELKEKIKISEISEFSIFPNTQDWKLGNLGNFIYLEFCLTLVVT